MMNTRSIEAICLLIAFALSSFGLGWTMANMSGKTIESQLKGKDYVYIFHKDGFATDWEWECSFEPGLEFGEYSRGKTLAECLGKAERRLNVQHN